MSEAAFENCLGILEELEPRFWGKVVDAFLADFRSLDREGRERLIAEAPETGRIGLQYQYLHHVRINCGEWDAETAQANFANLLWLASLGRFAEDWRDGVVAFESLLDRIAEAGRVRQLEAAWLEVAPRLPVETLAFLEQRIQKWIGNV